MQPVARVAQHLVDAPAVERPQVGAKARADLVGAVPLLARWQLVVLGDVVALQPLQRGQGLVQTGGGHAPGPDGRTHQVHRLRTARQPVAKDEAVQRPEDQALGATGGRGNDAHVLRAQAVLFDVGAGRGAGVEAQGRHGNAMQTNGKEGVVGIGASK